MRAKPEELEFGNFKILRRENGDLWELGRGGFGTTYKAEHTHLMRACALKVINDSRVASEDARRRFLQEARAAASLSHPHIAAVYDFGDSDGTFYYAMEFCAGGDLEHFVDKKGAMSWSEVEPLAVQIASALSRAHQSGLLHRDLKPSNVMLSSEDHGVIQLKLIDFGLVKVLDREKTSSTHVMVTQEGAAGFNPLTASPEQLRDEDLDERSDLFSFGITLLYLLCGGVPFGSVSAPLMMAQRLDDESYDSILPTDLTGVGREVVSRLVQKDRDLRFDSAEDVLDAIKSASYVVSPSQDTIIENVPDEAPAPLTEDIEQEVDWASAWEVKQIQQKCHSGSYYRCAGRQQGIPDVVMFMPSVDSPQSDTILSHADKLVDIDTRMLLSFADMGYMDGERAYVCQSFMREGGRLLQLLQAQGNFTLQTHLALFQQLSHAIDEAESLGLPGLELNAAMILVDEGELPKDGMPESSDEWLDYYKQQISTNSSFARAVSLSVLPKLENPSDDDDIQATVTLEDLATDPITKFGSLIYRSISGMSVRPAAYLRESGYVSTSNLGEESNRFLAEIIAGRSDVSSAGEIITRLCEYEGVSWDVGVLEGHISTRRDESKLFTKKIAGVGQLLTEALEAEQREREENERRDAKEREEKRVAEEKARAAAAAEELRRKEEEAREELDRKKREEEEAKAAAEAERLRLEEEARQKKEEKKKAAAEAKKLKLEAEKAAELKTEQDKRDAKARAAESKREREEREKREERERIAAEKEQLKKQEAEAVAAAALKITQEKEQKEKEEQSRKLAEEEKKRLEADRKAEAKKKEQAEKEQQKLQEEKCKADEAKRKAGEGKRSLADARKETDRLQKEALAAQQLAEKEKKKVDKEQEKLTQQQQGVTVNSKKKAIIIAAAAVIIAILAFVGIKSFSGDEDDGGGAKSGTKTVSTDGNGNTDTKDPDDKPEIKHTPVPKRTECVVIIPLLDGGDGIPDDADMELYSGGVRYGDLIKESGELKATIMEASPPEGEKFEVKFKNKNYTVESNMILKSDGFKETETGNGVFRYKVAQPFKAHAQFSFLPSLGLEFAKYKKQLFELLKVKDHMEIRDAGGAEINGAEALYDPASGKINISMPTGWSFDGEMAELKIVWPLFEALSIKIGQNGVSEDTWQITLKKYELDLAKLVSDMPKFEIVEFEPIVKSGDNYNLTTMVKALIKKDETQYSISYKEIKDGKGMLTVPCHMGDLLFSGGLIYKGGMRVKDAVEKGQITKTFPVFPRGFYHGFVHIPLNPQKGKPWITAPGMASSNLDDAGLFDGSEYLIFKFMFVPDGKQEWLTYTGRLKVAAWDGKAWLLKSVEKSQLKMELTVGRANPEGTQREFVYSEIEGIERNTGVDEFAKRRHLKLTGKGDYVYASIPMSLKVSASRKKYLEKIVNHLKGIQGEYKVIKSMHSYKIDTKTYPAVDIGTLQKLASP